MSQNSYSSARRAKNQKSLAVALRMLHVVEQLRVLLVTASGREIFIISTLMMRKLKHRHLSKCQRACRLQSRAQVWGLEKAHTSSYFLPRLMPRTLRNSSAVASYMDIFLCIQISIIRLYSILSVEKQKHSKIKSFVQPTLHKPIPFGEELAVPPSTPRWRLCTTNVEIQGQQQVGLLLLRHLSSSFLCSQKSFWRYLLPFSDLKPNQVDRKRAT